ncbi:MAG: NACHT domain-containing protein [Acidobacteriia bacterium]|nr:NACHT domain-containing protein [Terriglobia bacterium]
MTAASTAGGISRPAAASSTVNPLARKAAHIARMSVMRRHLPYYNDIERMAARIAILLKTLGVLLFLFAIAIRLFPQQIREWLGQHSLYSPAAPGWLLWMSVVLVIAGAATSPSFRQRRTRLGIQLFLFISLLVAGVWLARSWHPGDLLHKDHFEPLMAIIGAFYALLVTFEQMKPAEPAFSKPQLQRNRQRMLTRVRHDWIQGVLDQSLYKVARIDLGLEDRPDAVQNPLTLLVQEAGKSPQALPPRTRITTVFDDHASGLLVLGAAGSGKTTLLLELARDLLSRAEGDEGHQIPVVFNLSSWAVKRSALREWLIDELNRRYDVPRKLAQHWVDTGQILPLLDGLDEVVPEHRDSCAERINEFRNQHFLPMAVCSRSVDYQSLSGRLRMPAAVAVQPLTRAEAEEYIDRGGEPLAALRTAVDADPALWEVLDTPLMLSIATLAYRGVADHEIPAGGTIENRRRHLFAKYVDGMFKRRSTENRYTRKQTLRWLTWLASSMMRHGQSGFQLEALNRDWLQTRVQRALLGLSGGLVFGPIVGLVVGLGAGLVTGLGGGLVYGLVYGLVAGLFFGLFAGLFLAQVGGKRLVPPVDTLRWSSTRLDRGGLAFLVVGVLVSVLVVGLGAGLSGGLVYGLSYGLVYGLSIGLRNLGDMGFVPAEVITRAIPNEGTWRSGRNALVIMLGGGLVFGLVLGLVRGLGVGLGVGLVAGLFFGLVGMLGVGLDKGGWFFLNHWSIRLLLWRYRHAPFQYVRFLDYAVERIFCRKVGGGYIFVHRMLMEYFASLAEPKPQ